MSWREGDRVLAPWEPDCLYAGIIVQITDDQALIKFGDGDEGWVFLRQVRSVSLSSGQKVFCRRVMGYTHLPAEILEVAGDKIHVAFDDADIWTTTAALRIPIEPNGPGAVPTRFGSNLPFIKDLRPGARVWARWMSNFIFAGTVSEVTDQEAHINFDDGDAGWVLLDQLMPLMIVPGLRIMGRWKMGGQFFPGTVTRIDGQRLYIVYDDGDKEWTTAAAVMLVSDAAGPAARVTRTAHRWTGWILWLAIVVGIFFFRIVIR